jgi:hypothetical protein
VACYRENFYRQVGRPAECICVDLRKNSSHSSGKDGRYVRLATQPKGES